MNAEATDGVLQVTDRVLGALEGLAAKLGVTVDHLLALYAQQIPVEAGVKIGILVGFLVVFGILLVVGLRKALTIAQQVKDWDESGSFALCMGISILSGIVVLVTLMHVAMNLPELVTRITHPEYWAYKDLLHDLRQLIP